MTAPRPADPAVEEDAAPLTRAEVEQFVRRVKKSPFGGYQDVYEATQTLLWHAENSLR